MNIAVNTRFLLKGQLEGIGWFTFETLRRITRSHPEHHFYFLFDRPYDESFIFSNNVTPVVVSPPARHPLLWYYWFEWRLPSVLKKIKADVFLSPDGFLSLRSQVPTALVIHDIGFEHYPQHVGALALRYYRYFTPRYARHASSIATVSEYSKQDIARRYHIETDKISVVYNGIGDLYQPAHNGDAQHAKDKYADGEDYFLYAGAIQPRKNIDNLLRAFDEFKSHHSNGPKLVIAGRKAWKYQGAMEVYEHMRHKKDVVLAGHLEPAELSQLMAGSLGLTYVSHFEGFGIPLVEAMKSGVPVITSNVSSMPEVAGDAALLVQPDSVPDIAQAMERIYTDTGLRQQLISKGQQRQQHFSWDSTAERLWKVVEGCVKD